MLINVRHLKKVKLVKADQNKLPEAILMKYKAYSEELKEVYPSHVYVSDEFYKKLQDNVKKAFKKDMPYLRARALRKSVAMHMLNYGPNTSLGTVLKGNMLLVDVEAIHKAIALHKNFDKEEELFNSEPISVVSQTLPFDVKLVLSATEEIIKLEQQELASPTKTEEPSFFDGTFLKQIFKAFNE